MSNDNLPPRSDEKPAPENDVEEIPASAGPLGDYDAIPDAGLLPDSNALPDFDLPTTSDAGDPADDDKINITEHEGPNLQAGDDLDTGTGGAQQNP